MYATTTTKTSPARTEPTTIGIIGFKSLQSTTTSNKTRCQHIVEKKKKTKACIWSAVMMTRVQASKTDTGGQKSKFLSQER